MTTDKEKQLEILKDFVRQFIADPCADVDLLYYLAKRMQQEIENGTIGKKKLSDEIVYIPDWQTGERKVYDQISGPCYFKITFCANDKNYKWEFVPIDEAVYT